MSKKKSIIISIIIVIFIIILVSGVTYAYFSARTKEREVGAGSGILDINYSIDPENITGSLVSSIDRENGLKAVAIVSLSDDSEAALFNMYITPTALTSLNITAFKWEVDGIVGEEIVYTNSGNFSTASVDTPIQIVNSYALTTTDTTFNIYMWLDSSLIDTAIDGASFGAKITADSIPITGEF